MPHLDEGILSALLDGELAGAEQQEVEAHLRTCLECRDRLAELKGFMQVADQLVTALDEAPAKASPSPPARRRDYRALAWAASIVLAVGLGFAGRSLLLNQGAMNSENASGRLTQKTGPVADAPIPSAAPSPPVSRQESSPSASGGAVAVGTVPPAEEQRSRDTRNESPATAKEVATDEERRPGVVDSLAVDSTGLRNQMAGTMAENPLRDIDRGAAGAGAPAQADKLRRETATPESQGQVQPEGKDVARAGTRARENAAETPTPPAAMLQPRNEGITYAPLGLVGARLIPMEEAVRILGGAIRLVDSLTPVRVERAGADSAVRVVYLTAGVEIWLDQRRDRGDPSNLMQSGLTAFQAPLADRNTLSWNDLHGFYLTLTGPLPVAELERLKARIR